MNAAKYGSSLKERAGLIRKKKHLHWYLLHLYSFGKAQVPGGASEL